MTPLHLEILLWYHCRANEYDFNGNPTRIEYAEHLLADGVLAAGDSNPKYSITPRGRAFIEHILQLPFPKQQWVMP
jgi:hypothetical protein